MVDEGHLPVLGCHVADLEGATTKSQADPLERRKAKSAIGGLAGKRRSEVDRCAYRQEGRTPCKSRGGRGEAEQAGRWPRGWAVWQRGGKTRGGREAERGRKERRTGGAGRGGSRRGCGRGSAHASPHRVATAVGDLNLCVCTEKRLRRGEGPADGCPVQGRLPGLVLCVDLRPMLRAEGNQVRGRGSQEERSFVRVTAKASGIERRRKGASKPCKVQASGGEQFGG